MEIVKTFSNSIHLGISSFDIFSEFQLVSQTDAGILWSAKAVVNQCSQH